jgi:hypothetical protein
MKTRIMAAVAATTLVLSMGVATAGEISGPAIRDGSSPGYLQQQQQLQREPGYSVGTAAASEPAPGIPDYQLGNALWRVQDMQW